VSWNCSIEDTSVTDADSEISAFGDSLSLGDSEGLSLAVSDGVSSPGASVICGSLAASVSEGVGR
jgi:hypothetical protein